MQKKMLMGKVMTMMRMERNTRSPVQMLPAVSPSPSLSSLLVSFMGIVSSFEDEAMLKLFYSNSENIPASTNMNRNQFKQIMETRYDREIM